MTGRKKDVRHFFISWKETTCVRNIDMPKTWAGKEFFYGANDTFKESAWVALLQPDLQLHQRGNKKRESKAGQPSSFHKKAGGEFKGQPQYHPDGL